MKFPWQVKQDRITTYTDSDWAGCKATARSTSGGIVMIGDHMIKSYSRQQKVIALSSAEAELYAMVAASAETMAVAAYARDLGMTLGGEVYTDSSAALGISQRAGIGKVRHLRTQGLWVQEVRLTGRLSYHKVLGSKNPADILTKHVPADLLAKHMETLGAENVDGRSAAAPELSSVEIESWVQWLEDVKENENAVAGRRSCKVSFATKVHIRAIPHENKGRKCRDKEVGWTKHSKVPEGAGGVSLKEPAKKSWADLTEEEEEEKKGRKGNEERKDGRKDDGDREAGRMPQWKERRSERPGS